MTSSKPSTVWGVLFVLLLALTAVEAANEKTTTATYRGALGKGFRRADHVLSVRSPSSPHFDLFQDTVAYFNQRVDHFDPLNTKTYRQKYIVYDQNYVPGGPIFFFLGGEAPVEFFGFQEVYPRQLTQKFGALYVALEHRFYGVSMPAPDFSTDSLRLLSSRQALADAANFLVSFNKTLTRPGPWIVWGCSYSGALSAWFRAKYPNLVIGSIAPSGPVHALNNFTAYYGQFSISAPPACVSAVQTATNQLMSLLQTSSGRASVGATFNSCAPIAEDAEGQYYFLLSITDALGSSDQFQNPPQFPLTQACNQMTSNPNDYLGSWAQIFASSGGGPRATACNDFNEQTGYLNPMKDPKNANRSWMFQVCTEFGWFSTAYPGTSAFPPVLNVETQIRWCGEIFGIDGLTPDIDGTNSYYGGYNLRGSNILFTNGLIDPWHNLSINDDLPAPDGVSAVTYEAGHCAPMTAITNQDPISLTNARLVISDFLGAIITNN